MPRQLRIAFPGAIHPVTPEDKMAVPEREIFAARDGKQEAARQKRQVKRQAVRAALVGTEGKSSLTDQAALARVGPSRETEAGSTEEQPAEG
jgi:hypothetical protein